MFILVGLCRVVKTIALLAWWLLLAMIFIGAVIDKLRSRKKEARPAAA